MACVRLILNRACGLRKNRHDSKVTWSVGVYMPYKIQEVIRYSIVRSTCLSISKSRLYPFPFTILLLPSKEMIPGVFASPIPVANHRAAQMAAQAQAEDQRQGQTQSQTVSTPSLSQQGSSSGGSTTKTTTITSSSAVCISRSSATFLTDTTATVSYMPLFMLAVAGIPRTIATAAISTKV
jgi:hypothetical protein